MIDDQIRSEYIVWYPTITERWGVTVQHSRLTVTVLYGTRQTHFAREAWAVLPVDYQILPPSHLCIFLARAKLLPYGLIIEYITKSIGIIWDRISHCAKSI
jgi:hypothetical protein